ncbi:hypothetical protein WRSd3_04286 [Shigella dysenteriae WRSd3]|uniref:Uncharacterized protein n=1 Tax=Shigella dysenteriae WRSd3 TaxID=1401327 RepID=A0A090NVR7_SHIDY|nr:hypothetical protein WRSd3_p00065 [Shigella dysenteriae WRSd3]ESU76483.1 hypothetical protein WRSd3_04286 [Shigella dysenteriae WRSd3]ESU82808.1 hypothetical protein WRSd5_02403 [Shigella dysenteriae WRSd5]
MLCHNLPCLLPSLWLHDRNMERNAVIGSIVNAAFG